MNKLAWLLIALVAAGIARAQDVAVDPLAEEEPLRHYTVEIIIFTYTEDVSVGSEIFLPDEPPPAEERLFDEDGNPIPPDDEDIPVYGDNVASQEVGEPADEELPPAWVAVPEFLEAGGEEQNPFQLVPLTEDEFLLGGALRKFELLDAYETIMHFGWTQPAFPEEETPAIDIALLGEPPEGLAGTFTLYLSRYLHLVVDVALDAPEQFEEEVIDDDDFFSFGDARRRYGDAADALPIRFTIQDDRIFKNGDLRYFDHPRFGVLAKITRVEEPGEDADDVGALASSAR
jgi:hypothetical protein